MKPTLLLVDDHAFTRVTVAAALEARGFSVTAVGSAREALAVPAVESVDVALLDLDLGAGPTGLDLAQALRLRQPSIGIILLTSYRDPRFAGRGLPPLPRGGVYVCKSDVEDFERLVTTIHLIHRSPVAARKGVLGPDGATSGLTDHQVDVLLAVSMGMTTAQIAAERGVTPTAIEQTLARICDRLGIPRDRSVNQRVELVRAVQRLSGREA